MNAVMVSGLLVRTRCTGISDTFIVPGDDAFILAPPIHPAATTAIVVVVVMVVVMMVVRRADIIICTTEVYNG